MAPRIDFGSALSRMTLIGPLGISIKARTPAPCVIGATQRWTGDGAVASTQVQKFAIRVSQVRLVHTAPFERPVVPPVARMLQGRSGSSAMSGQNDGAADENSDNDGPSPPSRSRHMHCFNWDAFPRSCRTSFSKLL